MPPHTLSHRRTHNLLLISRLLSLRDNVSPFTLLLDSLSQSAKPLVREYIRRTRTTTTAGDNGNVVFVSFETRERPPSIRSFIKGRGKDISELQKEVAAALSGSNTGGDVVGKGRGTLLVIDSLNYLSASHPSKLCLFLSSLLTPNTLLLSVYHVDVPLSPPAATATSSTSFSTSSPHPLTLLKYLSTTLITTHSICHVLQRKKNKDVSLPPPVWGLDEGVEGVLVGLGSNAGEGVVLEVEYRRKSGRAVVEWFYLPTPTPTSTTTTDKDGPKTPAFGKEEEDKNKEKVILLEDHPQWRVSEQVRWQREGGGEGYGRGNGDDDEFRTTFELGITERQKKARDEVLLPYMDAQREGGGLGGAILFTPEKEVDDFDEEEDEL